ncbi:MAG: cupin domain-containing protein [Gammaproteobacteria bacterium]
MHRVNPLTFIGLPPQQLGDLDMKFLSYLTLLMFVGLSFTHQTSAASPDKKSGFSRHSLLNKTVTLPSATIDAQVVKVHFPPGYKTPLHTHEGPGPRYVLKGRLRVEDNGEVNIYKAGEVFWESGSEMTVENVSHSDAEIVIFQMIPAK